MEDKEEEEVHPSNEGSGQGTSKLGNGGIRGTFFFGGKKNVNDIFFLPRQVQKSWGNGAAKSGENVTS